jgi:dihydrofolate synthase / folylpolyglutamate synthase
MSTITTFAEAHEALQPFYANTKIPYMLEPMRKLLDFLGNPQNKLRVIHVAGTSGKTSTSYYAAALLQASGKTVGLTVSPHIEELNERLQVNGQPTPEAEFCSVLSEFLELIQSCDVQPSYFELLVAMAYWDFARRGLEYAVIEVGLGGLIDGTNVIDRADKVCIITDIGYDHMHILGNSLPEIAAQKAGIIQAGNTVCMYEQDEAIMRVVGRRVADQKASLVRLTRADYVQDEVLPEFQQRNLGLALAAVNHAGVTVGADAIRQAAAITIPARLERFQINEKLVIIDGSHNQQKIQTLIDSVTKLYPGQNIAALCSFVDNKTERWQHGLEALLPGVQHVTFTSFHSEQDMPKSSVATTEFVDYCQSHGFEDYAVQEDAEAALQALLERPEPIVLVTGSFYLLYRIRPYVRSLT